MTMTTTTVPEVPSVRTMLDNGTLVDYLRETGTLDNIAQELLVQPALGHQVTPRTAEQVLDGFERMRQDLRAVGVEESAELATQERFELTMEALLRQIDAEGLAGEVADALPEELHMDCEDQVDASLGKAWTIEVVDMPDGYQCGVTGLAVPPGKAVVIDARWSLAKKALRDEGVSGPCIISPMILTPIVEFLPEGGTD